MQKYKQQIKRYLQLKGVRINEANKPPTCECPDPDHHDNNPSAIIYDDSVYCPVCATTWDVFDIEGLLSNTTDFKTQKANVLRILGEVSDTPLPPKNKIKQALTTPELLTLDEAKKRFNTKRLLEFSSFRGQGDPKKGYGNKVAYGNTIYPLNSASLLRNKYWMIQIRFASYSSHSLAGY